MKRFIRIMLVLLSLFFVMVVNLSAIEYIGGDINEDTTYSSGCMYVVADLMVSYGVTLTITEGFLEIF